ncbi:MAG: uroporphyrinogen decarboxylase [Candidatus Rokubacteria bacterium]|nr:uroporphyrinogen decarboxylase [Candidatus Rokubacteria bacterium]
MNKFQRVKAAINREPVDRTPYAVWCHFPEQDRSPAGLAQATLRFHQRYDSDFIKLTPAAGYAVEDWGCVESDKVMPAGNRPCASHAVNAAGDWRKIKPLDITTSAYGQHLEALVRIMVDKRADAPVVPTVFSPLTVARKLSGDRLNEDLRERPEAVTDALEAITDTLIRFATMCLDEEAAGIFYAIQAASHRFHTEEEYAKFGEPYDRRILEAVMARAHLVILHAHGDELMFDRLARLPAHAWNWDDRLAGPSLKEGKAKVRGAVIGGVNQWATLKDRPPEDIRAEARDAVEQTDGIGLIVGPGCVLPRDVPDANVVALVKALGGTPKMVL